MAIKTYPLNDIEYQAEDAELFHCTRTSGVYASGHFPVSVNGADNNITIGKGIGWLKNTEFSGKVFASKEETTLNVGVPDASLPRVDAVVVRFDANQNETYFTIKQGSVGSTPTPPEVERGEYIYELHLYHIRRRPGATAITPGDITDLRMDANYCGLMADSVTQVDMSAINAQVREFITDWENQIANVTDGNMIESPEYPGCYYRMNRGVKEWLNPPMMEEEEYATTKRQEGKRVYTKLIKARSQAGFVSLTDIERIVSVFAVAERDWNGEKLMFQLPVDLLPKDSPTIQKMQVYYQENRIVFQSVLAKGSYNLYITVEYTKPGDEVAYTNVTADGDTVNVETNGDVSAQGDNLNVEMFTTVSADGGAYIRRLTINGVAYDLAVGQAGSGAPGTAYPGVPGQFYTDLDSGEVYVCMGGSVDAGVYIWRTIIPTRLPVSTIQLNHKTGIGSATLTASQGAILVENNGKDAIINGVANPVNQNDAVNKRYVDNLAVEGGSGGCIIPVDFSGVTVHSVNHRGYSATAPENTIPAYIMSKEKGFVCVEADVAFTADGVAVLLHDSTIDRTSNGSGSISFMTYAEVSEYDFGSWKSEKYTGTRIPTFAEFIAFCKNVGLHPYIELKNAATYTATQIQSLVEMVRNCGMRGKVSWISFTADYLGYVRDADPTARLGYLVSSITADAIATAQALQTGRNEVFMDSSDYDADAIARCQAAGLPIEIWTINNQTTIENMDPYITGVTSDNLIAENILREKSMNYDYGGADESIWVDNVATLDLSKLVQGGSGGTPPYITSYNADIRVLYAAFDIDVSANYSYRVDFTANTADQVGVTTWTTAALEKVAAQQEATNYVQDSSWQSNGYTFVPEDYAGSPPACIRLVFRVSGDATITVDDIQSITITRTAV